MAETSFLKRNWKGILNLLTVALLIALIIGLRHQLGQTIGNLARVHGWILLLIVPIELLNYHAQAKLYQTLFRTVGQNLDYKFLYKLSVELNFVNHVFPSGGVTGISYFGLRLRQNGISGGKSTVIQSMKLLMIFLSCGFLLILGVIIMAAFGRANGLVILLSGAIVALLIVGIIGFGYIVGSKSRINAFFIFATRALNSLIHIVRPHHPETISIDQARGVLDDFHENYLLFRNKTQELKAPFWWAQLANVTEMGAIYVVFLAFGHAVNVGAVILAYEVANFAGLVSVLPGGVGIYEALMTGVLAAGGVRAALSIPVIIMYRVVNTLIQLPPGYVLYHRNLNASRQGTGEAHDEQVSEAATQSDDMTSTKE